MTEKHTADEIMGLVKEHVYSSDPMFPPNAKAAIKEKLESAIRAIIEERDQAVKLLEDIDRIVIGNLVKERDAFRAENEQLTAEMQLIVDERDQLRKAIVESPETYKFVEEDDVWGGQQFC